MIRLRRLFAALLSLALVLTLLPGAASAAPPGQEITVLFTHDLHSHFLPQPDGEGGERGGYARLKWAIDAERATHPAALLVDGGDFSIGSLFQTLYTTQAAELRTMGQMGYDAVTLGNHEFDHGGQGLAEMLQAATAAGDPTPPIVEANYRPGADNPLQVDIQRAMATYGVSDYLLLERAGITFGIFGIMGEDSHAVAPTSGFELADRKESAKRCVEALREQGAQFIICLSHSGTSEKRRHSEDEQLARDVEGIDLIVSGHTHTTLEEPIVSGDTVIVSAGPYCENLGSVTFAWDGENKTLTDYHLVPIDETLGEDPGIADTIASWKNLVSSSYLGRYGLSFDQVLTTSGFSLETPEPDVQEGNALGELTADAMLWAALHLDPQPPEVETVAVTADGVLRAPLYQGEITTSDAFDVLSMGVGEDGTSGYPLVAVYLTGKELKSALEVDASIPPIMTGAQLYFSGVSYRFNVHRMFFNRVVESRMQEAPFVNGFTATGLSDIRNDGTYRVVTDLYIGQMLGEAKSRSFGMLSLEPKMADGSPVQDLTACILRDGNGNEIKAWYALASYLASFGDQGIPAWYAAPDGRKEVSRSWNPIELIVYPKWMTLAVLAAVLGVAVLLVLLVRRLFRRNSRRRYGGAEHRHYGGQVRRRRFGR